VGLIDITEPVAGGPPDVKVHPLVAQTVRDRAGEDLVAPLQQAVELFAAAVSYLDPQDPAVGAPWVALLPHLQALQMTALRLSAKAESTLADAAVEVSVAMLWGGQYIAALTVA